MVPFMMFLLIVVLLRTVRKTVIAAQRARPVAECGKHGYGTPSYVRTMTPWRARPSRGRTGGGEADTPRTRRLAVAIVVAITTVLGGRRRSSIGVHRAAAPGQGDRGHVGRPRRSDGGRVALAGRARGCVARAVGRRRRPVVAGVGRMVVAPGRGTGPGCWRRRPWRSAAWRTSPSDGPRTPGATRVSLSVWLLVIRRRRDPPRRVRPVCRSGLRTHVRARTTAGARVS